MSNTTPRDRRTIVEEVADEIEEACEHRGAFAAEWGLPSWPCAACEDAAEVARSMVHE